MTKKNYIIVLLILLIISFGIYWCYSINHISGTSDNGMWEATYKRNLDKSEPTGWVGFLKQKTDEKVNVRTIVFKDNDKVLVKYEGFIEGRSEDGSVTKLHPFSSDFYLGDAPKKGHIYNVLVTWDKNGERQTDTFRIK